MHRQVCTRIRVGVWGTSQAPTPVADRANSSIRLGSYLVGDATRLAIPSAAPACVVTAHTTAGAGTAWAREGIVKLVGLEREA